MVVAPNFNRSAAVSLNILNASETRVAIGFACYADRAVSAAEPQLSTGV
jgi:hypothetical protein